ncbi:MAG: hypothetical protein WAM92_02460 [Mycobacterium sp.]
MSKKDPTTTGTDAGPQGVNDDVESDPAKDTESGSDWSDEGGATAAGPSADSDD